MKILYSLEWLIEVQARDSCGSSEATRAEDPAASRASEAAETVPAESKRRNGKQLLTLE
ncbi:hypothetical protein [Planococcus shixiaomingii]|uniref:hypothetical protein n=1 Tax=Planococcus shixiaomingii TaxID=3058393 RepID=UPI0026593512|nr:hypothetical protein [Planococcus sp. N028]